MLLVLNRTKIGLLIRAGVENREMVEALGYRIRRLFVGVFVAGSALAGLGGVMWGLYREHGARRDGRRGAWCWSSSSSSSAGSARSAAASSARCWSALVANYTGFLVPKLALVSNILLMVAVLLWRPHGLYPGDKR